MRSRRPSATWERRDKDAEVLHSRSDPAVGSCRGSGQDKQENQTILFVCEHGSAKSVIAAAHFNRLAGPRKLPYRAIARGINPGPEIPQQVKVNLDKGGLDVAAWKPELVDEKDVREAARVVAFGCKLPFPEKITAGKLVDWQDVPSTRGDYERTRTVIVDKIEAVKVVP